MRFDLPTPKPMTITDLARYLSVSRWTASRLIEAGEFGPITGRAPKVPVAAVLTWLISRFVTPGKELTVVQSLAELPDLIPFETVAEKYKISLRSLKDGARARKIWHTRLSRDQWAFTEEQLEAFFAARNVATKDDEARDAMRDRAARRRSRTPRRQAA